MIISVAPCFPLMETEREARQRQLGTVIDAQKEKLTGKKRLLQDHPDLDDRALIGRNRSSSSYEWFLWPRLHSQGGMGLGSAHNPFFWVLDSISDREYKSRSAEDCSFWYFL